MTIVLSEKRLQELHTLLTAMGNRSKAPADGLGIYLGDGIPRGLGDIRSNELKSLVEEAQAARKAQYEWAVDAVVEACGALNKDNPRLALKVLRDALWGACNPKGP